MQDRPSIPALKPKDIDNTGTETSHKYAGLRWVLLQIYSPLNKNGRDNVGRMPPDWSLYKVEK